MSKELADKVGLVEGEKVIYTITIGGTIILRTATVTDVVINKENNNIVVLFAEFDGSLYPSELYTKKTILGMFGKWILKKEINLL